MGAPGWIAALALLGAPQAGQAPPAAQTPQAPAAPRLSVGDAAPELSIEDWLLGKAPARAPRERVQALVVCYVAELRVPLTFGPVVESCAAHAEDPVDFVFAAYPSKTASAAAERTNAARRASEWSGLRNLSVGFDRDRALSSQWIAASGFTTTPYAFLVDRQGVLAWRGRPKDMEAPLAAMLAGKWDIAKERERSKASYAADLRLEVIYESLGVESGKGRWAEVLALCDEAVRLDPKTVADVAQTKTEALLRLGRGEEARAHLERMRTGAFREEMVRLYFVVEPALLPPPGVPVPRPVLEAARACMLRAVELGAGDPREPNMLDRLAMAHAALGDLAAAIACQTRALEMVKGTDEESDFAARLARYRDGKR